MSILEKLRKKAELAESKRPRSFSLHISMPILVLGVVVLALTLGWSFFMGFLVGRGEDPGTRLNSLPIFGGGSKPKNEVKVAAKEDPIKPKVEAEKVKKEEPPKEEPPKAKPPHPFARPKDQSLEAWGNKPKENSQPVKEEKVKPKEVAIKDKPKEKPKEVNPSEKGSRIEVRYQVASFPREIDAQNLSKKCQAKGAPAIAQRFGKVFRVVLTFRGYKTDIPEFKAKCKGLGIKDWLVVSSRILDQPKNPPKSEKRTR